MLRPVLGVIVGYVVMFAVVFVALTVAYIAIGPSGAFEAGVWDPSVLWLAIMFGVGLVAAVVGGAVCALISAGGRAPVVLAGLVLVLGLGMAVPVFLAADEEPAGPRPDEVTNLEAMQNAKQPPWVAVANPILGAVGVVIGARLVPSKKQ